MSAPFFLPLSKPTATTCLFYEGGHLACGCPVNVYVNNKMFSPNSDIWISNTKTFGINVHALLSGNPLPADISTNLVVGLSEVLSSPLVFSEITLLLQCIWKRQPGATKGASFPFTMCCSMCCKAPGDPFLKVVHLSMLRWGS